MDASRAAGGLMTWASVRQQQRPPMTASTGGQTPGATAGRSAARCATDTCKVILYENSETVFIAGFFKKSAPKKISVSCFLQNRHANNDRAAVLSGRDHGAAERAAYEKVDHSQQRSG